MDQLTNVAQILCYFKSQYISIFMDWLTNFAQMLSYNYQTKIKITYHKACAFHATPRTPYTARFPFSASYNTWY